MTDDDQQLSLGVDAGAGADAASDVGDAIVHFAGNIVLRASAGTGKTDALASLYVHLVAGATSQRAVAPDRIVAMTFTDKAAAEMRERIASSLRHLAGPAPSAGEPRVARVLRRSLERRGQPLDRELFQDALRLLPAARIATISAFCASLLRAVPSVGGVAPDFEILDEGEARKLLEDAIVRAATARLGGGDSEVGAWVRDQGGLFGGRQKGVVEVLMALHAELAETGQAPERVLRATPYIGRAHDDALGDARRALGISQEAWERADLAPAWQCLIAAHRRFEQEGKGAAFARVAELAQELSAGDGGDIDALFEAAGRLAVACGGKGTRAALQPEAAAARAAVVALWGLPRQRRRAEAALRLLGDAQALYAGSKRESGALDFADLTLLARNLLRDRPALRRDVVAETEVLLVDELQDTNAVQRDLVFLLRAQPSVDARVPDAAELLPRGLFVVGDRKQSIYGFRNADVAVFETLCQDLVGAGGEPLALSTSYRSASRLVEATNVLAAAALEATSDAAPLGFELTFDPDTEALDAHVAGPPGGPCVDLIEAIGAGSEPEADAVARHICTMVWGERPAQVRDEHTGDWRAARLGDVALLLPRFTHLHSYLHALAACGAAYSVINGRGLLSTIEAKDMLALCRVLLGDDDGRSIVAVLRGPLVCLSDRALLDLGAALGARGGFAALLGEPPSLPSATDDQDRSRYADAIDWLRRARGSIDRVGLGGAMRFALRHTGYCAVLRSLPAGAQRAANVDRLLAGVAAQEQRGLDGREVFRDLNTRAAWDREPEADVSAEATDAVRVMTVHQSKGLQFPIVVAADLAARGQAGIRPVEHDRDAGIAFAVRGPSGAWVYGEHNSYVQAVRCRRDEAERRRLFYVQITRARDHLVLARKLGKTGKPVRDAIGAVASELEERGLLARVDVALTDVPAPPEAPAATAQADPSLAEDLAARARAPAARPAQFEVPVTQLEDFASCPRRFRARHVLRLPEHPRAQVEASAAARAARPGEPGFDPRRLGVLAHHVLERLDLADAVRDADAAVARAAESLGETAGQALLARLRPFLSGSYVQEIAALPGTQVHREMPLAFAVDVGGTTLVLRGQVDLLVDHGDRVDVIDYKTTAPRGAAPTAAYRFQLGAYALAVRRAGGTHRAVRAGVQFLDGKSATPTIDSAIDDDGGAAIADVGAELLRARRDGRFEGRDQRHCEALGCGYRWLCHG